MFIVGQRFLIGSSGHSFSRDASRGAHVKRVWMGGFKCQLSV